jgi:hypothetical protein
MASDQASVAGILAVLLLVVFLFALVLVAALWTGRRLLAWTMRVLYTIYFCMLLTYIHRHQGGWGNEKFDDESVMNFS